MWVAGQRFPISPMEEGSGSLLLFVFFVLLAAAAWVALDVRVRFPKGLKMPEGWAWVVGTFLAGPIFLPIYLIARRPVGAITTCPSCGRGTISHRASCIHCGQPITFESVPTAWGLGEVVGVVIAAAVSLPAVIGAAGLNQLSALDVLTVIGVAQNTLFVLLVAYIVRWRYHQRLATIGLTTQRWPWWAAAGVVAGAVTIPVSAAAERLAIAVIALIVGPARAQAMAAAEEANQILATVLQTPRSTLEVAWLLVLLCVVVPVGEEVFFRGFLYTTLRRWGWVRAVVFSSALFAAVHLQVVHFLPILWLGVVLALLYERTGSLVASIAVHSVNNLVAALSSLYSWSI